MDEILNEYSLTDARPAYTPVKSLESIELTSVTNELIEVN
jgi:hypothetical protein